MAVLPLAGILTLLVLALAAAAIVWAEWYWGGLKRQPRANCHILHSTRPVPLGDWSRRPPGAVTMALYRSVRNPVYGMLCHRLADGTLIPIHRGAPWHPDLQYWTLEDEQPLPGAFGGPAPRES